MSVAAGMLLATAVLLAAAAPAGARTHRARSLGPIEGHLHTGRGEAQSTNWSGYAAYGTTFTSVQGSWVQPTASCSLKGRQVALAAFWVGLDGYDNKTVEQTGSEADCEGKTPVYYAWWEFYPERLFLIEHEVEPGDQFHAEVTQTKLWLEDATQGWSFEKAYLPGTLQFASAEWIAEAPFNRFTDFGEVEFTDAFASDSGGARPVEEWAPNLDSIDLVSGHGRKAKTLAEPQGLSGSSFSIVQP